MSLILNEGKELFQQRRKSNLLTHALCKKQVLKKLYLPIRFLVQNSDTFDTPFYPCTDCAKKSKKINLFNILHFVFIFHFFDVSTFEKCKTREIKKNSKI